MKIPKRFALLGITYTVRIIAASAWKDTSCVGFFNPDTNEIHILKRTPEQNVQTFWHEAVHCILSAMGRDKLYRDESFVDLMASMIQQLLTTGK